MKAWQDPAGVIRDVCQGDPHACYVDTVAAQYSTEVPDGTLNSATLIDGSWVNPPPPGPPVPAPPAIPASVTRKQAKLALVMTNHFDAVVVALSAIPGADGAAALIEWNDSETFERDSDFLRQMASTLGMSSADLDSLFDLAATL